MFIKEERDVTVRSISIGQPDRLQGVRPNADVVWKMVFTLPPFLGGGDPKTSIFIL